MIRRHIYKIIPFLLLLIISAGFLIAKLGEAQVEDIRNASLLKEYFLPIQAFAPIEEGKIVIGPNECSNVGAASQPVDVDHDGNVNTPNIHIIDASSVTDNCVDKIIDSELGFSPELSSTGGLSIRKTVRGLDIDGNTNATIEYPLVITDSALYQLTLGAANAEDSFNGITRNQYIQINNGKVYNGYAGYDYPERGSDRGFLTGSAVTDDELALRRMIFQVNLLFPDGSSKYLGTVGILDSNQIEFGSLDLGLLQTGEYTLQLTYANDVRIELPHKNSIDNLGVTCSTASACGAGLLCEGLAFEDDEVTVKNPGLCIVNPVVVNNYMESDLDLNGIIDKHPILTNIELAKTQRTNDVIGVRVYTNPGHLDTLSWYSQNLVNPGNPVPVKVDGYDGLLDDRTAYINAANISAAGDFFTNIYVIAHNINASPQTVEIFNRIVNNWRFNRNILKMEGENEGEKVKDRLRRDVTRLQNINEIRDVLERYRVRNGKYPDLAAGTFEPGHVMSTWPTWNSILGNELGVALPVDPINKMAVEIYSGGSAHPEAPRQYDCTDNYEGASCTNVCSRAEDGTALTGCRADQQCVGEDYCSLVAPGFDPQTGWNDETQELYFNTKPNGIYSEGSYNTNGAVTGDARFNDDAFVYQYATLDGGETYVFNYRLEYKSFCLNKYADGTCRSFSNTKCGVGSCYIDSLDACIAPGQAPYGTIGAVSYFNFNEGENITVNDSLGESIGVLRDTDDLLASGDVNEDSNLPAWGSDPGTDRDSYLSFNEDDYVLLRNTDIYNFKDGDFSVGAWIRPSSGGSGTGVIMSKSPGFSPHWQLVRLDDGRIYFALFGDPAVARITSSEAINDGEWHHIVVSVNRTQGIGSIDLYIDGNKVFTQTSVASNSIDPSANISDIVVDNDAPVKIGILDISKRTDLPWRNNNEGFNGDIDDVLIVNRALSDQEVSDVYNGTFAGNQVNYKNIYCFAGNLVNSCGNGIVQVDAGETCEFNQDYSDGQYCDDAYGERFWYNEKNVSDTCTTSCNLATEVDSGQLPLPYNPQRPGQSCGGFCGDGTVEYEFGEQCDEGSSGGPIPTPAFGGSGGVSGDSQYECTQATGATLRRGNLLPDPSFENESLNLNNTTYLTFDNVAVDKWASVDYGITPTEIDGVRYQAVETTNRVARSGNRSAFLHTKDATDAASSRREFINFVDVVPGETYEYSAWVRRESAITSNGTVRAFISFYDNTFNRLIFDTNANHSLEDCSTAGVGATCTDSTLAPSLNEGVTGSVPSDAWVKLSGLVTIPQGVEWAGFTVMARANTGESFGVYIDDVDFRALIGCQTRGGYCGDGVVQTRYGEQCDIASHIPPTPRQSVDQISNSGFESGISGWFQVDGGFQPSGDGLLPFGAGDIQSTINKASADIGNDLTIQALDFGAIMNGFKVILQMDPLVASSAVTTYSETNKELILKLQNNQVAQSNGEAGKLTWDDIVNLINGAHTDESTGASPLSLVSASTNVGDETILQSELPQTLTLTGGTEGDVAYSSVIRFSRLYNRTYVRSGFQSLLFRPVKVGDGIGQKVTYLPGVSGGTEIQLRADIRAQVPTGDVAGLVPQIRLFQYDYLDGTLIPFNDSGVSTPFLSEIMSAVDTRSGLPNNDNRLINSNYATFEATITIPDGVGNNLNTGTLLSINFVDPGLSINDGALLSDNSITQVSYYIDNVTASSNYKINYACTTVSGKICQFTGGYCGDGIVQDQFGEACDNGSDNGTGIEKDGVVCSNFCSLPSCGDGKKDIKFERGKKIVETCDWSDPDDPNQDFCNNSCTKLKAGASCVSSGDCEGECIGGICAPEFGEGGCDPLSGARSCPLGWSCDPTTSVCRPLVDVYLSGHLNNGVAYGNDVKNCPSLTTTRNGDETVIKDNCTGLEFDDKDVGRAVRTYTFDNATCPGGYEIPTLKQLYSLVVPNLVDVDAGISWPYTEGSGSNTSLVYTDNATIKTCTLNGIGGSKSGNAAADGCFEGGDDRFLYWTRTGYGAGTCSDDSAIACSDDTQCSTGSCVFDDYYAVDFKQGTVDVIPKDSELALRCVNVATCGDGIIQGDEECEFNIDGTEIVNDKSCALNPIANQTAKYDAGNVHCDVITCKVRLDNCVIATDPDPAVGFCSDNYSTCDPNATTSSCNAGATCISQNSCQSICSGINGVDSSASATEKNNTVKSFGLNLTETYPSRNSKNNNDNNRRPSFNLKADGTCHSETVDSPPTHDYPDSLGLTENKCYSYINSKPRFDTGDLTYSVADDGLYTKDNSGSCGFQTGTKAFTGVERTTTCPLGYKIGSFKNYINTDIYTEGTPEFTNLTAERTLCACEVPVKVDTNVSQGDTEELLIINQVTALVRDAEINKDLPSFTLAQYGNPAATTCNTVASCNAKTSVGVSDLFFMLTNKRAADELQRRLNNLAEGLVINIENINPGITYSRWSFDEGLGRVSYNVGPGRSGLVLGSGVDATTSCFPQAHCSKNVSWPAGKFNKGLELNGDDYIITNASYFNPNNTTISFWVNIYDLTKTVQTLWSYYDSSSNNISVKIKNGSSLIVDCAGAGTENNINTINWGANTWHNIIVKLDNRTATIYIDGVAEATTASCTVTESTGNNLIFGATKDAAGAYIEYVTGVFDEARIYDEQLTASQISDLFAGIGVTVANNGLVAQYLLDDGISNSTTSFVTDNVGFNNGVVRESPTWVTGKNGSGGALSFGGTADGRCADATYAASDTCTTNNSTWEGDHVEIPASADLTFASGETVEMWIKLNSLSDTGGLLHQQSGWSRRLVYNGTGNTSASDDNKLTLILKDSNNVTTTLIGNTVLTTGKFYNVAYTFDPLTKKASLYVDGVLDGEVTLADNLPPSSGDWFIGRRIAGNATDADYNTYFNGVIDNVSFYNKSLSANIIQDHYSAGSVALNFEIPHKSFLSSLRIFIGKVMKSVYNISRIRPFARIFDSHKDLGIISNSIKTVYAKFSK